MNATEITKTATTIVKTIKDEIKARKEVAKTHPYADTNVHFYADSVYDNKAGKYVDYIEVAGKQFKGMSGMYEIQSVSREVVRLLDELRKTRGWGNLTYNTTDVFEGVSYYNRKRYILLDKVSLPDNPCKDFKAIQTFVKKYGNCTLPDFKLFSSAMGGKRGRLWDEYGDRHYLANKPNKCARIINELRLAKGSKDIVTCKFGEEDYIDDAERRYSEYHEVECEGEKRHYLQIIIKSPAGKVKYQQKIY